jgi:glycosyltransferase involved in cell wall biosynthesis
VKREVTVWRVGSEYIGYGYHGIQMIEALKRIGVEVHTDPKKPTNVVFSVCTPLHLLPWYENQTMSLITMWETDYLPPAYSAPLVGVPKLRVFVPNHHNVELFARHGVPAEYVPEGVNPVHYSFVERPKRPVPFRFLHIGFPAARKGTDLVLRAFKEHFAALGCELWLKTKEPFFGRGVVNMDQRLTVGEMMQTYANSHCFVGPSRGEGWYLPPFEALATGMPTIVSNNTGMKQYAHLCQGAIEGVKAEADYNMYGFSGTWTEPDYDELVAAMFAVYENYPLALESAAIGAREIAAKWTWDHAAQRYVDLMGGELSKKPPKDLGKLIVPSVAQMPIVPKCNIKCDIGPKSYDLHKGQVYSVPWDAKRVLHEGGMLDDSNLCPFCSEVFPNEGRWQQHLKEKHEESIVVC